MTNKNPKNFLARAFTLIELLVVIAIIGVLASILLIAVQHYRTTGRDAERVTDINRIAGGLELYYNTYHYFPPAQCGYDCTTSFDNSFDTSWDALNTALSPYIGTIPKDPVNSSCAPTTANCYSFMYGNVLKTSGAPRYTLIAQLESSKHPQSCGIKHYIFFLSGSVPLTCAAYGGNLSDNLYEPGQ